MRTGSEISEGALLSTLGYLGPLCLLPLLIQKGNRFSQFHGRQALLLFLLEIIFGFGGLTLFAFFRILFRSLSRNIYFVGPFLDFFFNTFLSFAYWICFFTIVFFLTILGGIKAWKGEFWEMPILGEYIDRLSQYLKKPE